MRKCLTFRVIDFAEAGYHWLIPCTIDNENFWLVIDTGATRSVIDGRIIGNAEIKNHPQGTIIGFDSQSESMNTSTLKQIQIDGKPFWDFEVAVADLSNLVEHYSAMANVRLAGILGCDFIMNNASSINIQKKKIYLKQPQGENE